MATSSSSQANPWRMLDSCKSMEDLKQVHSFLIKSNHLHVHPKLLLSLCSSSRDHTAYAQLLRSPPTPSAYAAALRGLSRRCLDPNLSMALYSEMLETGLPPGRHTFPPLLKALAARRALPQGRMVHSHVVKTGLEHDAYTRNALTGLYLACGEHGPGRTLFDRSRLRDLVSWTTVISGYARAGRYKEAVSLFLDMTDGSPNVRPDAVAMATVLSACARLGDLELGRRLHRYCVEEGAPLFDVYVGNALVDMYSKSGDAGSARGVFRSMRGARNVVTWNAMINGLARNNRWTEAVSTFRRMQHEGPEPDGTTLVGVLGSCANLGSLELGEWVRCYMARAGIGADGAVGNALVDMYAKCGRIDRAMEVFARMGRRDVYAFTAMIAGLAAHGRGERALGVFSEMAAEGVRPNGATLVGVLSACSHSGLVGAGLGHFGDMRRVHGLEPRIEHYGCVVDMLGRAGLVDAALELVERMPVEPDASVWASLLGHCRVRGDVGACERIAEALVGLEPDGDAACALVSGAYASAGRWGEARRRRKKAKKKKTTPGCSLIEVGGVVQEFRMGDVSHRPDREKIYMMVEEVGHSLRSEEGHKPFSSSDVLE
ncbi:pentatricopeptide repeat-containing protein-like, chloroplastic [Iris pallida]|uniref:Pentatricopeptide repeat-containing protein-like, chloroplastic n=1 Tax=Iris pallida TaxID=29817 RepID=A0AAX6EZB8_IRIPA|nr:pentatricopeptide repeat-containing protein-like, chloroplastic [Iris pallida]